VSAVAEHAVAGASPVDAGLVAVRFADGSQAEFAAAWLRDNCPCAECLHPSGQRLLEIGRVPAPILTSHLAVEDGALVVEFAPDGHVGRFDGTLLREAAAGPAATAIAVWDAALAPLPWHRYADVAAGGAGLRAWLSDAARFGFALLEGVPARDGAVTEVAELFGHVRVTNYGRLFDVRSVVDPANLAYTSLALGGHTDNPYRRPVPTLQLLHCLSSTAGGGLSTLVDGFAVAARLRDRDPSAYALLTSVPVRYRYADAEAELEADGPVIELDATGEPEAVRFNTRSARPPAQPAALMARWYAAYRDFAAALADPDLQIEVRLRPGDLVLMDNRRVLHGRTGYDATAGTRHLQGCYADIDGLRSTLAVLSREAP
jgi:gamma-butyrobetaine dioxygenase